jgi:hypothetical protein
LQKASFQQDSNFLKAGFHQVESLSPSMTVLMKSRQDRWDLRPLAKQNLPAEND